MLGRWQLGMVFLLVLLIGFALYLGYGIQIGNRLLIVTNAVALITYVLTVAVTLRFRRPEPQKVAQDA